MKDNSGKYFLLNGIVRNDSETIDIESTSGKAAYEVIRIINGVPLFFEDHYERLKGSLEAIGLLFEGNAWKIKDDISRLLSANGVDNCNVKIVMFEYEALGQLTQLFYISKSYYPPRELADTGVKTGMLQIERNNPNAKVLNHIYKNTVTAKIQEGGYYEVLLLDNKGRITEGSKSNAFFIKGNFIFTAPGEFVLKGITRQYVFEACRNAGFEVTEQFVEAGELQQIDAAFLSGTSIKVLPIKNIDQIELNSSANPVVDAVRREYDKLLERYLNEHA